MRGKQAPWEGGVRGETVSILYFPAFCPCHLLPLTCPLVPFLQDDISAPGRGCFWGSGGVTGSDWEVTGVVPFASEEGKAAEVQILPDNFM